MTAAEALERARAHLVARIVLKPCAVPPPTIYFFDPGSEFLFSIEQIGSEVRIGALEYIAVSRTTGEVRSLGFHGE